MGVVYDDQAPAGTIPAISHDELWQRLDAFLEAVLPIAEEEGVKLSRKIERRSYSPYISVIIRRSWIASSADNWSILFFSRSLLIVRI